tara:strand:- start:48 stop:416 length:369 start_codon:yes stop_codon:yes gene_type:complete
MSGHNILQQIAGTTELEIVDPGSGGTIPVDRSFGICPVVTGGAESRKIASPERAGIIITVCLKTDGGDLTITGSGSEIINSGSGSETTAVMADAGDVLTLISINKGTSIIWAVIANHGATLS